MRTSTGPTVPTPRSPRSAWPEAGGHVVPIPSVTPPAALSPSETGADGRDPDLVYLWAEVRQRHPTTEVPARNLAARGELRFRYD